MIMQGLLEVRAVGLELPGELRKPRPLRRREVARLRDQLRIAGGEEPGGEAVGEQVIVADGPAEPRQQVATVGRDDAKELKADFGRRPVALLRLGDKEGHRPGDRDLPMDHDQVREIGIFGERSEEHTSELQSLMRISYAVFCLKKKTQK